MAKKNRKRSTLTRRDLLKTIAVGSVVGAVNSAHLQSKAQSIDGSGAVFWRTYSLVLMLYVPRIYNNSDSLGYRKYQRQRIIGKMAFGFNQDGSIVDIQFYDLTNKTHRLSNKNYVTYRGFLDQESRLPQFNVIGNNKTGIFKTASICFNFAAEPSYNIGEFDEDTSLYITLAGRGTIDATGIMKRAQGYAAGTLGCGCRAYGHVSPTRELGYYGATDNVTDVASVCGTWTLKLDT